MKKRIFVAMALLVTSVSFAQQKKEKQPPPPPPVANVKEIPPPPPPKPTEPAKQKMNLLKDYTNFLKRNPTVKGIEWSERNEIHIRLKSGKEEVYDMNDESEIQKLKSKYGELPAPPPPPPPPPKVSKIRSES
jgi:hypothetical protein